MHLKVGELARSSGLTVRTLHHYDEIGLLKPSGRSEAGYRLYSDADIARLHGIQALRHLGLPLADIASMLDGKGATPQAILSQQLQALEREIAHANELRTRLEMIRDGIIAGESPDTGDWLEALSLMATYGKYFSTAELKKIFADFRPIEADWRELMDEVGAAMAEGADPTTPRVQVLARRWMALMLLWMGGDFELLNRWGDMYERETHAHGRQGGPSSEVLAYMHKAIEIRMAVINRHFTQDDLRYIRHVPEAEWRAVDEQGQRLLDAGKGVRSREVRSLAKRWLSLVDRLVGGHAPMREKTLAAWRDDPQTQDASAIRPEVRALLLQAVQGLDPHVT